MQTYRAAHCIRRAVADLPTTHLRAVPPKVSAETIRSWPKVHRRGGFDGLLRKPRADRGQSRSLPREVCSRIRRAEIPRGQPSKHKSSCWSDRVTRRVALPRYFGKAMDSIENHPPASYYGSSRQACSWR